MSFAPPCTTTKSSHFKDLNSSFTVFYISFIWAPGFTKPDTMYSLLRYSCNLVAQFLTWLSPIMITFFLPLLGLSTDRVFTFFVNFLFTFIGTLHWPCIHLLCLIGFCFWIHFIIVGYTWWFSVRVGNTINYRYDFVTFHLRIPCLVRSLCEDLLSFIMVSSCSLEVR